jgi:hypothetical protein
MTPLLKVAFRIGLALSASLTRNRLLRAVETRVLTPLFVRLTRAVRGTPRPNAARTPEAFGREWERLLGYRRYAHVTRVDASTSTVYGEITGRCPLRGTGDLAACDRLMAYDRGLMAPLGARFVVLASQAEPGRTSCLVAMRAQELDAADLVPAHRLGRARQAPSSSDTT